MRRIAILLACVLAMGGTAGCGRLGGGEDPGAAPSSQPDSPEERMRQFAQCMRDNGVEMKDPEVVTDENGRTRSKVQIGPGPGASGAPAKAGDAIDERFKKAEEACKHLIPQGGDLGEPNPEEEEHMRAFSKCMRENGVTNFPDPQPGGGIAIGPETGVNPEDPAFKEAEKKCDQLVPPPSGRPKVTS